MMKVPYVQINRQARIEPGPARMTAVVTDELLAATHAIYKVGAPDALGRKITPGEPMQFHDWLCRFSDTVWYVYILEDGRYVERAVCNSQAEAEQQAEYLSDAGA